MKRRAVSDGDFATGSVCKVPKDEYNPIRGKLNHFAYVGRDDLLLKRTCPELRVLGAAGEMLALPYAVTKRMYNWCEVNGVTGLYFMCGDGSGKWYVKFSFETHFQIMPLDKFR